MTDLVTLNEVKIHLTIKENSQENDFLLQQLIGQVSEYIRTYTRKAWAAEEDIQEYITPGENELFIYVKKTPISAITHLKEDGAVLVENTDFFADYLTGIIKRAGVQPWATGDRAIDIKYDAGEAAPGGLKMIVCDLIGMISGLKKKTYITGEGIEAAVTITTIPDFIKAALNAYKRPLI